MNIVGILFLVIMFLCIFKKPRKKAHLYIQNAILVIYGICFLFGLIMCICGVAMTEYPKVFLFSVMVFGTFLFLIVKKFLKNLKLLSNNEFEADTNDINVSDNELVDIKNASGEYDNEGKQDNS